MRESELHKRIFERSADLAARFEGVVVGPGDDCAVVRTGQGDELLMKVDQLVEGRHFVSGTGVDQVARKAIARAVSDIAAMAGVPLWGLAAGVLPEGYPQADELCERLAHWARHWGAPLVGGDIACGAAGAPLVLSVTMVGKPHAKRGAVLRSGARPGDELWVTGRIGGSFQSGGGGRHLTFEPRLREAAVLADALGADLHAMLDVSDGLGRDAGRMAAASGVRIVIECDRIPLSDGVRDPLKAAADGEDYELLVAAAPGAMSRVGAAIGACPITRVGTVVNGRGCVLAMPDGREVEAAGLGWDH